MSTNEELAEYETSLQLVLQDLEVIDTQAERIVRKKLKQLNVDELGEIHTVFEANRNKKGWGPR